MNKTQIGDISEQKFILYCLQHEVPVCRPIGNNLPYDFIIDYQNCLYKIQVKTAYPGQGKNSWIFKTRSTSKNYSEIVEKDYIGKIDFFAVVNPTNDFMCFVPINQAAKGSMSLYYGENPTKQQNYYKDYFLF